MPKYHCPHCQESLEFENGNKFNLHQGACRRWKNNKKNKKTSNDNDIISDLLEEGKRINKVTKREREIKLLHERDPTFLGGGEFIPAKVDDRIHESYFDPEEVEEQEQTKRAQPEEEALGYNTTMLLSKKTVGILGFGNIGQALAKILMGFDCKINFFDVRKFLYKFYILFHKTSLNIHMTKE